MVRFGLWYDFRNPAGWRRSPVELYAATLEQIEACESLGYDEIWTTEHHFVEDGYPPSLLPICGAIAARTSHIRIGTAVLLLPFHDPVRLAEDTATVDIISGGRFDLGVGIGYRMGEFESFGIDFHTRGKRMNEASQVVLAAWGDEPFTFEGEFYAYQRANMFPKPVQQPMPFWFGGLTPAAARRAGKYGTGFIAGAGPSVIDDYVASCEANARPVGTICKGLGISAVSEDPDAAWAAIREHVYYQRRLYADWLNEAGSTNIWPVPGSADEIRETDPDIVVTPQRAVELIGDTLREEPRITDLYWHPTPPGLSTGAAYESIELFARKVMPEFR